jgi:phospholipid/cholesterol/gamma-HCH transport system permease protein
VLLLAAVSGMVGLVLTYVIVYGFNPYALPAYTRTVGQIFQPAVTLIFSLKTVLFSVAVAVVPMAAATWTPSDGQSLDLRGSVELQGLVRMFMLLLLVEMVSLVGNYY